MNDLDALLRDEAEYAEQHKDAPAKPGTKISRPGHARSTVYSVRLNPEEVAALQALADTTGLPASTLVRSWIIERIRFQGASPDMRKLIRDEVREAVRDALKSP